MYQILKRKFRTFTNRPRAVLSKYFLQKPIGMIYKAFLLPQPDFVADKSWDNLIVLDACRFDVFQKCNDIPGKLVKAISPASGTAEWFQKNFTGRDMKDVVYISAHPYGSYYYVYKFLGYIPFYKIVEVWKTRWSDELGVVHPSAVNEGVLDSLVSYPQKRYLIHYVQPHRPFIGDVKIAGDVKVWDMLREKTVSARQVWRAYIANLELVLDYVKKLLPNLSGRTCITSDHGNAFGRFNLFYGHALWACIPELVEVPWLEVDNR